MRFDKRFCARTAVTAGLFAAAVSVFGLSPVHAQTTPAMPAAAQQGPMRRMSIDDAVATALEQNLDLQVQRINPQLQDLTIAQFKAAYTPNFVVDRQLVGSDAAVDQLPVRQRHRHHQRPQQLQLRRSRRYAVVRRQLRRALEQRPHHHQQRVHDFNPQLNSSISATYTQPLLRNFKIDGTRQQLLVSQKNKEITDMQLQQSITLTTRNVRNAYYDLVCAIGNLAVQRQSLQLSRAVVEGQPRPRRDRHHGAARHRPGRSRSGDARGSGDHRRSGDRAAAGHPARARLQPVVAGLLDGAHRADRHRSRSRRWRSMPTPRSRPR